MEAPTSEAASAEEQRSTLVNEAYYNEYVEFRGRTRFSVPLQNFYHRRMLAILRPQLPRDASILEVGFGHGHFAEQARNARIPYAAIDMSEPVCELARSMGFKITHAAFPGVPEGSEFNVIWMSHVLEHARDWHEARAMARAAYELLPPSGVYVVICPDIHSWKAYFWSMDWSHGYPTSAPRLIQLFHDVGFREPKVTLVTTAITIRPLRAVLDMLFALVPVELIDGILGFFRLRPYCSSFMSLFGWRHVVITGRREA